MVRHIQCWQVKFKKATKIRSSPCSVLRVPVLKRIYNLTCCVYFLFRSDGLPTEPIILPTDRSFYLFQYKRDMCQKVANMQVRTTGHTVFWLFRWCTCVSSVELVWPPMNISKSSGHVKVIYTWFWSVYACKLVDSNLVCSVTPPWYIQCNRTIPSTWWCTRLMYQATNVTTSIVINILNSCRFFIMGEYRA